MQVYLRKVYPEWHVATLLQGYQLRSLIMILDGVDEAAGMRQYIEDFVLRVRWSSPFPPLPLPCSLKPCTLTVAAPPVERMDGS